ncbi:MAG TPA: thiamine-phosphate kinase [Bryobacteraceae bacterium]|nr:thiamine-phosphate kinase [Bryobacteraceae bacterium]
MLDCGLPAHTINEGTITERLRKLVRIPPSSALVTGIGDDCAIYRPRGSADDLLFTTDLFIEGVHFLRETHKAADVARKAVARSLSDIAAMGGTPAFCLASVCLPRWASERWIQDFFDTLAASEAILAGGDLARAETFACDVTVCGTVPRGTALLRSGARPGHEIYVSGALGGSALGLATNKGKARKRHLNPEPRLALGRFLREKLHATAAMDISDGLSLDLHRLCLASSVSADIVQPPRFPGASPEQALHGGEEYELLFCVRHGTRVPAKLDGLPLTRIGVIASGAPGEVRLEGAPLEPKGFDHFRTNRP